MVIRVNPKIKPNLKTNAQPYVVSKPHEINKESTKNSDDDIKPFEAATAPLENKSDLSHRQNLTQASEHYKRTLPLATVSASLFTTEIAQPTKVTLNSSASVAADFATEQASPLKAAGAFGVTGGFIGGTYEVLTQSLITAELHTLLIITVSALVGYSALGILNYKNSLSGK